MECRAADAGSRIGLESTGIYHELLADLAHAQGHTVFLLNPLDTKHYAAPWVTALKPTGWMPN